MAYPGLKIVSVLVMAVVAWAALGRLPAGARLPTHRGIDGQVDGWMPAEDALFMPLVPTVIVSW